MRSGFSQGAMTQFHGQVQAFEVMNHYILDLYQAKGLQIPSSLSMKAIFFLGWSR
jgi:hypothetical protein